MKAAIEKIETFSVIDGPGIRTVIFFQGCHLRCKYCHNPETWNKKEENTTQEALLKKVLRNKPYFQENGGITLSGGEPLLHQEFLIPFCRELKKENIHIALDTAGIGNGNYQELLSLVDIVILDIKHIEEKGFQDITQTNNYQKFLDFIKELNKSKKEVWIRQVIIPEVNDTKDYIEQLANFIKENIQNVTKVEFLPFHTMAFEKYKELNMKNPYEQKKAMDKVRCQELENYYYKVKEH